MGLFFSTEIYRNGTLFLNRSIEFVSSKLFCGRSRTDVMNTSHGQIPLSRESCEKRALFLKSQVELGLFFGETHHIPKHARQVTTCAFSRHPHESIGRICTQACTCQNLLKSLQKWRGAGRRETGKGGVEVGGREGKCRPSGGG